MAFRKVWVWLLAATLIAGGAAAAPSLYRTAVLGSGVMAQLLCSGTFVSRRDPEAVMAEDLSGPGYELLWFFQRRVDRETKSVTASLFGSGRRTAIFRDGLGCTLAIGRTEAELRAQADGVFPASPPSNPDALWPDGERVDQHAAPQDVDASALNAGVEALFAEPDPAHPRRTRALVVVHGGRIVAERYAPHFDATMPLIGWSMAKTAINALTGILVQDGTVKLTDKALLPEWQRDEDPRREITLDQLLRMTSGLEFNEDYADESSDAIQMLFVQGDNARFAASKPLASAPGTHWHYSGGTSNIIALILRQHFADEKAYLRFPQERLFGPLGMRTAVLEPDSAGTFVGSSFMYASARDWARLGLFFLRDGVWQGRRLLPEGWVAYTVTPTESSPNDGYGAHVWLKLPDSSQLGEPPMPEDAYYMLGYDQQIVAAVPSRDLVIVRLGLTRDESAWDHARELAPIVRAFPRLQGPIGAP
jgi:CubicO group peptidase (beta-lactamase class C family)